jgi:SAM-dependent methyltransferase
LRQINPGEIAGELFPQFPGQVIVTVHQRYSKPACVLALIASWHLFRLSGLRQKRIIQAPEGVRTLLDPEHSAHISDLRTRAVTIDDVGMRLGGNYIMFFAEAELMREHARRVTDGTPGADVLEIGLGLGVFAEQLSSLAVRSYTVVEPLREVVDHTWERVVVPLRLPSTLHLEPWQTARLPADAFDAVMYDSLPPEGQDDRDFTTFVEQVAMKVLRPGGRLTFFSPGPRIEPARIAVLDALFAGWSAEPFTLSTAAVPDGWTLGTNEFRIPVAVKC